MRTLWPEIVDQIPEVMREAALTIVGNTTGVANYRKQLGIEHHQLENDGWRRMGKGACSIAYRHQDAPGWVLKVAQCNPTHSSLAGADWGNIIDSMLGLSPEIQALAAMMFSPTVVYSNLVVVQKKVHQVAAEFSDTAAEYPNIEPVDRFLRKVGDCLGIMDLHNHNWGINEAGDVQIFDPMLSEWRTPGIEKIQYFPNPYNRPESEAPKPPAKIQDWCMAVADLINEVAQQ